MALEPKKKEEEVEQEPAKLSAQELQALMPTASPLEEEVTPQSNPGFGLPEIREDISEVGTKSHSIDFLTEGLGSPMAGSAGLDPSLENDQLGQVNQNTEMASQILLDPNLSSDVRLQKAKDKINTVPKKKTIGEVYMDVLHPGTPDRPKGNLAFEFDLKSTDDEHKALMVNNLTENDQSFDDYVKTPSPVFDNILKQLQADRGEEDTSSGSTLFDVLDYATPFFDPRNDDDKLEVDIGALASEALDLTTPFTFVDEKNAAIFEKRYGPEWRGRMFSWVAKEVAVDAAILFAAALIPPLAPLLAVGSGLSKSARFGRALVRASVVGVGGGSTHAMINKYIGREAALGTEVAAGFFGTLGGEALVKLMMKGLGKAGGTLTKSMKSVRKAVSEEQQLPTSKRIEDGVKDFRLAKDPIAVTEIKASLFSMSKRFIQLTKESADAADPGLGGKEKELITERISDITGYTPKQLTTELALGSKIFFEEELGPITKSLAKDGKEAVGTGNTLADRILMDNAIGTRIMGDMAMRQNKISDEMFAYIFDDKLSWRPNVLEKDKKISPVNLLGQTTKALKKRIPFVDLVEPDQLPMNGLAKDYMDSLNLTGRYIRTFQRALRDIDIGLSGQERKQVDTLLSNGSEQAKVYHLDELRGNHSEAVIDAYYATRSLLDINHYVLDRSITTKAIKDGVMVYNNIPVNTLHKRGRMRGMSLTDKDVKEGKVLVAEVARDGTKIVPKKVARQELSDLQSMLPAHTGYLPRSYKKANYHVTVVNTATGSTTRTHALPNAIEARRAAKQVEEEIGAGTDSIVIHHKWDSIASSGEVGFTKNTMNVLDSLDPDKRDVLKRAFVEAGIDDADTVVKRVMDAQDLSNMRKKFTGRRGEVALRGKATAAGRQITSQIKALDTKIGKTKNKEARAALRDEKHALVVRRAEEEAAPLVPTRESVVDYMMHTAKRAGSDEWRDHAWKEFVKTYDDVLSPKVRSGNMNWFDDKAIQGVNELKTAQMKMQRDATQMQTFLKRTIHNTSPMERRLNNWMTSTALEMAESPIAAKRMLSRVLDTMPHAQKLTAVGRGIGSVPKLLFMNVAQVAVQGSQAMVTLGANPIHATKGLSDLMRATMASIVGRHGARLDKQGAHLLHLARKSGYLHDLLTNDMAKLITHKANPVMRGLGFASAAPFRLGEATNRGLAFFTSRRKFLDQQGKGIMNGIDDKAFKGAVDDDEFMRVVVDNAKITALNMGKAGELQSLSGFNSVIFQFKQVLPKMTNIFETGRLSSREKLGAAAAMVGFWGVGAIPLIGDLVAGADYMAWMMQGDRPSDRETITQGLRQMRLYAAEGLADMTSSEAGEWGIHADLYERLIKKGAFNVGLDEISDSEWNIAHRVVLGRFITEAFSTSGDVEDLMVMTSVLGDVSDFGKKSGIPVTLPQFLDVMYKVTAGGLNMEEALSNTLIGDVIRGERGAFEATVKGAKELGQAISYVGSIAKYIENSDSFLGFRYDRQEVKPGFGVVNPNQENFFTSTRGQTTNIEVTPGRLRQLIFGITPGALIEEQEAVTLEMKYLDALKVYRKESLETYNNTSAQGKIRVIGAYMSEMEQFRTLLTSLRLKNILPEDYRTSSLRMFLQNDLTRGLPKESPLEGK